MSPLNDAYETCERTCAKLQLYCGDIHPSVVTERLSLNPTHQVVLGEESPPNSLGLKRVGKVNGWFLSSEEHVKSKDVRHHLDWLLAKLEPNAEALRELQSRPGVRTSINCPWWSQYGDGGPTLWPEQMQALANLNLELSFEFAYYGPEEFTESAPSNAPQDSSSTNK